MNNRINRINRTLRKISAVVLASAAILSLTACSAQVSSDASSEQSSGTTYTVGICSYVDDASLNQIVDSITARLDEISAANNGAVTFNVKYDNCNADANVMSQIVSNFITDNVDLMIGVATPVAMTMQSATEDNRIPVVFSAVSDPLGTGLAASLEAPGANVTGTSDMLNTGSLVNMIIANKPDIRKVGLLYDAGQDSSTAAIREARELLAAKGIEILEQTGTTVDEVVLAANALVAGGAEAVFTPTDNTVMTAELSIYEIFSDAGIPHYCGADSFALSGAFLGFGVNYADLGKETADMAADILMNKKNPGEVAVKTFDNGIVSINEETMNKLGLTEDAVNAAFSEYASSIQMLKTAEAFN